METVGPTRRARVAIRTANGSGLQTWQAGSRRGPERLAKDSHEDIGSPTPPHSLGEGHPNCQPWTGLGGKGRGGRKGQGNEVVTSDQV